MASFRLVSQNGPLLLYMVELTPKGKRLIEAWYSGNRSDVEMVLSGLKDDTI